MRIVHVSRRTFSGACGVAEWSHDEFSRLENFGLLRFDAHQLIELVPLVLKGVDHLS